MCREDRADCRQLLDLMRRNVEYNGVEKNVRVEELNWGEKIETLPLEGIDIVLAADCVYFEVSKRVSSLASPFLHGIRTFIHLLIFIACFPFTGPNAMRSRTYR